jgi:glycopeptide antibiotics resistance protein
VCGAGAHVLEPGWGVLALAVILPAFLWLRRTRLSDAHTWLVVVAIVYLDVLVSLTFFPLPLPPYDIVDSGCPFIYTRPFGTIGPALRQGLDSPVMRFLIGNLLAFMPLGVLLPLLRQRAGRLLVVLTAGFLLSLAIEAGQLLASLVIGFPYRQADVDDVLVNTFGAGLGYGLLVSLGRLLAPLTR